MSEYPNLAKVATSDLVEKVGASNFSASYINWSRTMHLLRTHAPGWLPEAVTNDQNGLIHRAPVGAYVLIRFVHADGRMTPCVPQAIMDNRNNSIPLEKITSRDITDTQVRGICKAAALLFGLAYELWAKMPLESGYVAEEQADTGKKKPEGQPTSGVWEAYEDKERILEIAAIVREFHDAADIDGLMDYLDRQGLETDCKAALWTQLDSKIRSAIKKATAERKLAA